MDLRHQIETLHATAVDILDRSAAMRAFEEFKSKLNSGEIRAAEPSDDGDRAGWIVNEWVKKGILLGFRLGELKDLSINDEFRYFDKSTFPLKKLGPGDQVRMVPGGSSIRDGAFVARGVVIMPPAYINIGAFVDEGTMIDSHALVGSCAQIGKRVHLSAGSQVGGVLEPVGAFPVIVEDEVFIGGNCGIYEGTIVKRRAVLAAGVILTGATPLYDAVRGQVYRRSGARPLIVPENAVVVPGSRALTTEFARQQGLGIYAPVIVKYRDSGTDAATALEASLR